MIDTNKLKAGDKVGVSKYYLSGPGRHFLGTVHKVYKTGVAVTFRYRGSEVTKRFTQTGREYGSDPYSRCFHLYDAKDYDKLKADSDKDIRAYDLKLARAQIIHDLAAANGRDEGEYQRLFEKLGAMS